MRGEQSSLTALGIAAMRAVETARRPDVRICDDPYARRFVPTLFYYIAKLTVVTGYAEWASPV